MELNVFPNNPSEGDTVTVNGVFYKYTSGVWNVVSKVKTNLRERVKHQAAEAGFNLVDGSFEEGGTLASSTDVLWYQADGKYYSWFNGSAKTVVAGSTPATSGGFGAGAWVDRTQDTIRSVLSGNYGLTTNQSTTISVKTSVSTTKDIETKGFYSVSDGGGASFYYITNDSAKAGEDPTYYTHAGTKNYCVFDASGNVFALKHNKTVFARKIGVLLDGVSDDVPKLQEAVDSGVFSVIKTYSEPLSIKSRLVVKPNIAVRGGFEFNSVHKHTSLPSPQHGTCYITYRDGFDDTTDAAILLREYSEFSGYVINHPGQVQPAGTEIWDIVAQPWAIATATKVLGAGPADGIKVKDVHFANSYRALSLDGAAQYDVSNISGQPLMRGLEIDRQYDVGVVNRVHFWTFSWNVGTPIYNWIRENGMAFDICRCDGAMIINPFAYGYRVTYRFGSNGFGSPWCTLVNACADASIEPVRNDAANIVKFVGGDLICTTRNAFAARIAGSIARSFDFNGTTFFGDASASAALVSSSGGSVNFNSCYLKGENGNDLLFGVVNASDSTVVSISGAPNNQNYYRNVYGRDNTYLNGMRLPILGDSQIPSASENNFRMLNWSAGAPVGWSFLSGGPANVTQVANGIKVHVNAGETITLVFPLPLFTNDNFIFEANIKASGVASYNYNLDVNLMDIGNNSDNILTLIGVTDGGFTEEAVRYTCNGHQRTPSSFIQRGLRINMSGFGACNCDIEITNLRLVMPSRWSERSYINNSPTYLVGTWYGMQLQNHPVDGGVWTGFNDSVPTSGGEWLHAGDRIVKRIPTVGKPKAWVCTAAGGDGFMGALVSEGNL